MARSTVILNFSTPPSLAKEIDKLAKKEDKTRSELLRDAFKAYVFKGRLESLQQKGAVVAQKLGLESYDDIENFIENE